MSRLGWTLASLLIALAAAGVTGAGASRRTATTTFPSIYVDYSDDCVFTMHADGGIALTSATAPGPIVPPGNYELILRAPQDAPSCPMNFQLVGPGVQLRWEFGKEAIDSQATETLLPSSTYVATDLRDPNRYRAVFTTAATGSSNNLVTQTTSTATGKGQILPDLVGSALLPNRGTLGLTLAASGSIAVTAKGTKIRSVRAGRYDLAVADRSTHGGLAITKPNGHVIAVTSTAFVGSKTTKIDLTDGSWSFRSGHNPAVRLIVVK